MDVWIALAIGLIFGAGIGWTLCVMALQKEIRLIRRAANPDFMNAQERAFSSERRQRAF